MFFNLFFYYCSKDCITKKRARTSTTRCPPSRTSPTNYSSSVWHLTRYTMRRLRWFNFANWIIQILTVFVCGLKMLDERSGRRALPPAQSTSVQSPNDDDDAHRVDDPPATTSRGAAATANISAATNASSTDIGKRSKAATTKKTTNAPMKAPATTSRAAATSARGGRAARGGGSSARGAKTDLNISVTKPSAATRTTAAVQQQQPSIQSAFGSQSTRSSQRGATSLTKAVAQRQVTQYISSDSEWRSAAQWTTTHLPLVYCQFVI